jgi:glycosyltransferase involved in cell wall biosynthesis
MGNLSMPSPQPLISVALCTYNGEKYIRDQLESIINQSLKPNEIVICDDCSKDHTIEIVKSLSQQTEVPIRLNNNPHNFGYVKNFEKAISLCKGNIIFLCDQDDVWHTERIEGMTKPFVENDRIGFVYCDAEVAAANLKPFGYTVFASRKVASLAKGQDRQALEVIRSPDLKGCLIAFKSNLRSVFLPIPEKAKEQGWGHDHWFTVIAHAITEVCSINRVLMSYRRHAGNCGQDQDLHGKLHTFSALNKMLTSGSFISDKNELKTRTISEAKKMRLIHSRLYQIKDETPNIVCNMATLENYIQE